MINKIATFEDLMSEVNQYMVKPENIDLITRAYELANKMHAGQLRKSGEPYVTHVIQVGYILATLRSGPKTIAAGLLHDVIEDCQISDDEVKSMFGEEVLNLVESVTKIGNIEFKMKKNTKLRIIVRFLLRWLKMFVSS